jgi:hypothetical protein
MLSSIMLTARDAPIRAELADSVAMVRQLRYTLSVTTDPKQWQVVADAIDKYVKRVAILEAKLSQGGRR